MKPIDAWTGIVFSGLLAAAAPGAPAAPAAAPQAQIAFANHHGIYSWSVLNDRTLLIQSESGAWYKATLMSSCVELPFAETIGFDTNPDGSFDRFSAILVRHQRCPLISLVRSAPPAKLSRRRLIDGGADSPVRETRHDAGARGSLRRLTQYFPVRDLHDRVAAVQGGEGAQRVEGAHERQQALARAMQQLQLRSAQARV